ncbi:MAG: glycosyltransferase family 2 protein [Spirochaetales bacterium]|nr:glycosyltransferase family 2 protein [Spirochaetales bacterium]
MTISLIIPCYNEEEVIKNSHERISSVLKSCDFESEILYINDGSKDSTLGILESIAAEDPGVRVLSFSRNFGHQPAVAAGLEKCAGDAAIIMDADMQDPPELIPQIVEKWKNENVNSVYMVRAARSGESLFKKATAALFYRLINWISEVDLPVDTGDFRLIDRLMIDEFNKLEERKTYIRGLMTWVGFDQVPMYYERDPRLAGETKYPLSKMIRFAMNGIMSFTKKPLQLATHLGLLNILVGLGLVLYVFISRYSSRIETVPGWASIMIVIIFFGGVQLLCLGLLGEYLGRVFDEAKKRPDYIIQRTINL